MRLFHLARAIALRAYYEAARANLERTNPAHPDLLHVITQHDRWQMAERRLLNLT